MVGSRREVKLELKTAVNTGLGGDLVVEVGSSSTSENSCEATVSIPATKVATLEALTPFAFERNALAPVRGKDACTATSSSVGPSKDIA